MPEGGSNSVTEKPAAKKLLPENKKLVARKPPAEMAFDNPQAAEYLRGLELPAEVAPLEQCFPQASPSSVDLLSKLLAWEPARRLTAAQALPP